MTIITDVKLDFKDVMLQPKRSTLTSRSQVDLKRRYTFRHSDSSWDGTGIIAANMDHVGTMEMAKEFSEYGLMVALHKHYSAEMLIDFFTMPYSHSTFYSMGITEDDIDKYNKVNHEAPIHFVCIDVANGYSTGFLNFVKRFRDANPHKVIMAGNVVTGDMTQELILGGVDIVKVGIGPGSVCTTRVKTGVGYPQLSAIMECADAAHGLGGHICGDGGCAVPGDISKAFGGGSDFVMLGGMLSGHSECSGDIILKSGNGLSSREECEKINETHGPGIGYEDVLMKFYGMSSKDAQEKHNGGVAEYRASEGKCVEVPYRGPVEGTLQDILGGIRSACTYIGARNLKDLPKCTTFVRCTQQENQVFSNT